MIMLCVCQSNLRKATRFHSRSKKENTTDQLKTQAKGTHIKKANDEGTKNGVSSIVKAQQLSERPFHHLRYSSSTT